ncbi:unnamed protein product [Dibothriocephalus latus]|uniref:Endonuclease/exonuclease/phosphatase domain-containing protein n=1 Tax=Dibothriocephalus latus TaxID=60516 RepID=A0A3P7M029_DIBLA|nr:unnamed protein product [Dibothriocephalus latus]
MDELTINVSDLLPDVISGNGFPEPRYLNSLPTPRNDPGADALVLNELKTFARRSNTLIVVDFNAPTIIWSSSLADCPESAFDYKLLHVTFPTRILDGQRMNSLDLVLTKSPENIDIAVEEGEPLEPKTEPVKVTSADASS